MRSRTAGIAQRTALAFVLGALVLSGAGGAQVQTETDQDALRDLARMLEWELALRRGPLYTRLLEAETEPQRSFNRNPDLALVGVDERGHPVFYTIDNLNAARTVNVDEIWPGGTSGFGLAGAGTQSADLGVWDAGGILLTHQELIGRVSQGDVPAATHWHATHVAGTMAASGLVGAAKGMSYAGQLSAYDWANDGSEMATAAANGMEVSNHSYGFLMGWGYDTWIGAWVWWGDVTVSTTEDYRFGFYDGTAQSWDQIAVAAPYYSIVKSAGNDHAEGPAPGTAHWHWDPSDPNNQSGWVWATDAHDLDGGSDGYDCLPDKANAKNVLTVGAVADVPGGWTQPSDVVIAAFSSRGPTDDGRIKPDLVANGDQVYSCHDAGTNQYATASGTSMATPNVSGAVNLLVRHFEATHGGVAPRAATLKALLIHTASEAGPNPGPDYIHGWGLLDALASASLIRADSVSAGRIIESVLDDGESAVYYFSKGTSAEPMRVTLAWTDPAATPPSPGLNPTTSMLVNDLDVTVEDVTDGTRFWPWTLDPSNPNGAASRSDNVRDNVERVDVAAGAPAGAYRVTVRHKGTLSAPQAYSIVGSHDLSAPVVDLADHDVGNVVLTMTDRGILGFLDTSQEDGSGLIYPAGGSNMLYIGGLWVAQGDAYIANRDYAADPAQEWVVSEDPDGHVVVEYGGDSDQAIHAAYTDDGGALPRGLLVRQESHAWTDATHDDFVIVRTFVENRSENTLADLRVGIFLDLDLGSSMTDDEGATDAARQLVYMNDGTGTCAGVALLEGDASPDGVANLTLVHNPTYVWPNEYILDEDKLAFLAGSDAEHIVPSSSEPDDWSLLVAAGPFDLPPDSENEIAFALVGGMDLDELRLHADRAQLLYLPASEVADGSAGAAVIRLVPNRPNPFATSTVVGFELTTSTRMRLEVVDVAGRRVRSLGDGGFPGGMHSIVWDGSDDRGHRLASGVYFLRLTSGSQSTSRRITLLE